MTKIQIAPRSLGIEFLNRFDCVLNSRKNKMFCGKIGKTQQLSPLQQVTKIGSYLVQSITINVVPAEILIHEKLLMKKIEKHNELKS